MRLIDADKLIDICRKGWKLFGREDEKLKHWVDEDDIKNQPTVDAVPVIRCKDCKHWECDDNESYCRELGIFDTDMNSYCSCAKRKEE